MSIGIGRKLESPPATHLISPHFKPIMAVRGVGSADEALPPGYPISQNSRLAPHCLKRNKPGPIAVVILMRRGAERGTCYEPIQPTA